MKQFTLSILFLFISIQFVDAQLAKPQNVGKLNAKQLSKLGEAAMEVGDWYSAVAYWERFCEKKPNDFEGATQLGHAHKASRNFKAAEAAYKKAFELKPEKNQKAQFYWGMMQKINGDCESATENFKKFKRSYSSKEYEDAKDFYKHIRIAQEGCELDSIQNNIEIEHLNSSVNGGYIEYAPMPIDENTLIYGSLRDFQSKYYGKDEPKPVRKFYKAEKINGEWKGVGEWEAPFNFDDASTGSGAYSPDGKRFYFSKCAYNRDHQMICQLYISRLEGKLWSSPELLPEPVNIPGYSSSQPSVAIETFKNNEVVYFVSNRPEGKGGRDIWYAVWKGIDAKKGTDKGWYSPRNCGIRVNSKGDEYSPFYDLGSGQMYYSTAGDPGLGGLDIFSIKGEKGKWEDPVNLGAPINSSYDDLFYTPNDDGETGFFTSNREGSLAFSHPHCCDDLYAFKPGPPPPPPVPEDTGEVVEVVKPTTLLLEGRIVEELENGNLTDTPVSGALVKVNKKNPDGTKEFIRQFYTKDDGLFSLKVDIGNEYELSVKRSKYFNKNDEIIIPESEGTYKKDVGLVPISDRGIVIKNIYYEFDKSNLTPQAEIILDTTLVELLKENPALIVEISSHTDSKGADSYNNRLSQNRAESVVKYLQQNGIDGRRLQAKGYGESTPIAPNENEDGSDNPDGRQLNRRTEFKVVGELDVEIDYQN